MIQPRWYFPWRAARRFFVAHLIVFSIAVFFVVFSVRYEVSREFSNTNDIARSIGRVDRSLQTAVWISVLFVCLSLLWTTRKYVLPLGRIIQRARQLRKAEPTDAQEEDSILAGEEAGEEEPGEWQDLERVLVRLHRDLRTQSIQLKIEREELAALVGAVSDAIISIDGSETVRFMNAQFGYLFGRPSGNSKLSDLIRAPNVLESFRAVLATGSPSQRVVQTYTQQHRSSRFFVVSVAPMAGQGGVSDGCVGVFHDITELKAAEQIRIEFVANASHELRTPLTALKGYIETLKADVAAKNFADVPQFIDILSKNVNRLQDLVEDLLDLSAIESGAEMTRSIILARAVTESATKSLRQKLEVRKQTIQSEFAVQEFRADAKRVEQVLTNLIDNAIKYGPENSRIDIKWEAEPGVTILRVKDYGPGIPPEHQPRLFERFYRVDPGRSREQGGTGLGLAIVKHIMMRHGGSVQLNSQVGHGSEFICRFPDINEGEP